jgi:hypothetical protein
MARFPDIFRVDFPSELPEGRWIEIPAHRIYAIPRERLFKEFDLIGESGETAREGEMVKLVVRKRDGKVFKPADFAPARAMATLDVISWVHLKEV